MVAVPLETAVTTPVEETVATAGLDDVQVTALLFASKGYTVSVRSIPYPGYKVAVAGVTLTLVAGTDGPQSAKGTDV